MSDKIPASYGRTYGLRGLIGGAIIGLLTGLGAHSSVSERLYPKPAEEIKTPGVEVSPEDAKKIRESFAARKAAKAANGLQEKRRDENGKDPKDKKEESKTCPLPGIACIEETPAWAVAAAGALTVGLLGMAFGAKAGKMRDAGVRATDAARKIFADKEGAEFKRLSDVYGQDKAREMMAETSPEWKAGLEQSREAALKAKAKAAPPSP